jgi:hypothetical protein
MRGFGLAFLVGAFLGLAGCGADNETEAERLNKKAGPMPTTDVKGGELPPQSKSMEDYAARHKEDQTKDPMKGEYVTKKSGGGSGRR